MGIEVLVLFRGMHSSIAFTTLPTYATFRRAISADVVGHDAFQVTGTTVRGAIVAIRDQASFIRALGTRKDMTVEVREQLEGAPVVDQQPPPIGASPTIAATTAHAAPYDDVTTAASLTPLGAAHFSDPSHSSSRSSHAPPFDVVVARRGTVQAPTAPQLQRPPTHPAANGTTSPIKTHNNTTALSALTQQRSAPRSDAAVAATLLASSSPPSAYNKSTPIAAAGDPASFLRSPTSRAPAAATCVSILDCSGDVRSMAVEVSGVGGRGGGPAGPHASAHTPTHIWMGEKDTGRVMICRPSDGAQQHVVKPWGTVASPNVGCLCMVFVPTPKNAGHVVSPPRRRSPSPSASSTPHHASAQMIAGPLFGSETPAASPASLGGAASSSSSTTPGRVWCGFANRHVLVFDSATRATLATLVEHSGAVVAMEYHSAAHMVFTASLDFTILQWDASRMQMQRLLARHGNAARCLCIGPWQRLISGGDDKALMVWHAQTGEHVAEKLDAHTTGVRCVTFHQDALWTGAEDGNVSVWTLSMAGGLTHFDRMASFRRHQGAVTVIRGVGTRLFTSAVDKHIHVYDAVQIAPVADLAHPHDHVMNMTVSQVSHVFKLWAAGTDRKVSIWTVEEPLSLAAVHSSAGGSHSSRRSAMLPRLEDRSPTPPPVLTLVESPPAFDGVAATQVALIRTEVDEASQRAMQDMEESRERMRLQLLSQRQLHEKFWTPVEAERERLVKSSVGLHHAVTQALLESHAQTLFLVARSSKEALSMVSRADLLRQQALATHDRFVAERDNSDRALQTQLRAVDAERHGLRVELDECRSDNDRLRTALETERSARISADESLKHYQEELKSSQKRHGNYESDLRKMADELLQERHRHEREYATLEGTMQQRLDDLNKQHTDLLGKFDALEREERKVRAQLASSQDALQLSDRRVGQLQASLLGSEKERSATAEADRAFWREQLDLLESQLSQAKEQHAAREQQLQTDLAKLSAEHRDMKQKFRIAQDEQVVLSKKHELTLADAREEIERRKRTHDDARSQWLLQLASMEELVNGKNAAVAAMEAKLREQEAQTYAVKSQLSHAQGRIDSLQGDLQRLKTSSDADVAELSARLTGANAVLAEVRDEVASLNVNLGLEKANAATLDRRLQSAEEHYDTAQRRHQDDLQNLQAASSRDKNALETKLRQREDAHAESIRELSLEADRRRGDIGQLEKSLAQLQGDHASLIETNEFLQRKVQIQAQEAAEQKTRHADEIAQIGRASEARRVEIDDLNERLQREVARLGQEIKDQASKTEELAEVNRALEHHLTAVTVENDACRRRIAELQSENKRNGDRLNAERQLAEDRLKDMSETTDTLRNQTAALRHANDELDGQLRDTQRKLRESEEELRLAKEEMDRVTRRFVAQTAEMSHALESLRKEKREVESRHGEESGRAETLQAQLHEAKAAHTQQLDDLRRTSRIQYAEAMAAKETAEATTRRIQVDFEDRERELARFKAAEVALRDRYEALVASSTLSATALKRDLDDAAREKQHLQETHSREVKRLQQVATELKGQCDELQRQVAQVQEERRAADKRFEESLDQERRSHQAAAMTAQAASAQQRQKLQDDLEESGRKIRLVMDELQRAKEDLKDTSERKLNAERTHAQLRDDLEQRIVALSRDLELSKRSYVQRHAEAEEATTRARREQDALVQQVHDLSEANVRLMAKATESEGQLTAAVSDADRERRRAADCSSEAKRHQERLASERDAFEGRLRDAMTANDALRTQLAVTADKLDRSQSQNKSLNVVVDDVQERLKQYADAGERNNRRIDALQGEKERLAADMASERARLEQQLIDSQARHAEVQRELTDSLGRLSAQCESLQRDKVRLDKEHRTALDELANLASKSSSMHESWTQEREDLSAMVEQTRHDTEELAKSCRVLERECADAKEDAQRAQSMQAFLTQRLQEQAKDSNDRTTELQKQMLALSEERDRLVADNSQQGGEIVSMRTAVAIAADLGVLQRRTIARLNMTIEMVDGLMADKADLAIDFSASLVEQSLTADVRTAKAQLDQANLRHQQATDAIQKMAQENMRVQTENDRLSASGRQNSRLIEDVREELTALYQRYKIECESHDQTKVDLMAAKAPLQQIQQHNDETRDRLTARIKLLEAERDGHERRIAQLQDRLEVMTAAHANSLVVNAQAAQSSGARASSMPRADSVRSTVTMSPVRRQPMSPEPLATEAERRRQRHQILVGLIQLLNGLRDALRLMQPLGASPLVMPDTAVLVCVYGWLNGSKSRGELLCRQCFGEDERREAAIDAA